MLRKVATLSNRGYGSAYPIGRTGTGRDIADVVFFLAGDKASLMAGEHACMYGCFMALGARPRVAGVAAAEESS